SSKRQSFFSLALLAGTLRRSMVANAQVSGDRRGDSGIIQEQRRYQSAGLGHMELGLGAELYPGAIADEQSVPWFGIIGSYRHSFFLTSFGCPNRADLSVACDPTERLEVKTTQSELYLGARGRFRIGDDNESPELTADL